MRFEVIEIDLDTYSVTSRFTITASSFDEAGKICEKKTWKKYKYYVSRKVS